MRDRFENFIKNNRDQFDDKVPSLRVWSAIEKQLEPPKAKRISLLRVASIAASVIILLGIGALGGNYFTQVETTTPVASLDKISTEYGEMERDFQKQILDKKAKLASYNYEKVVSKDLEDLDLTLNELRKELINVPKGSEEKIVEAMIKNYKTKIQILEIVLEKIDLNNSKKEGQYEGTEM